MCTQFLRDGPGPCTRRIVYARGVRDGGAVSVHRLPDAASVGRSPRRCARAFVEISKSTHSEQRVSLPRCHADARLGRRGGVPGHQKSIAGRSATTARCSARGCLPRSLATGRDHHVHGEGSSREPVFRESGARRVAARCSTVSRSRTEGCAAGFARAAPPGGRWITATASVADRYVLAANGRFASGAAKKTDRQTPDAYLATGATGSRGIQSRSHPTAAQSPQRATSGSRRTARREHVEGSACLLLEGIGEVCYQRDEVR